MCTYDKRRASTSFTASFIPFCIKIIAEIIIDVVAIIIIIAVVVVVVIIITITITAAATTIIINEDDNVKSLADVQGVLFFTALIG
jgi:hypothetical protein